MKYDLSIYGLGPASVFLIHSIINTKIKIAVHETGEFDKIGTINNFDKIKGPFFFNKKERTKSVFGSAALWKQPGIGGHLFYFDKEDFKNWPINYPEICKKYNEVIKLIELSTNKSISSDFEDKNFLKKMNLLALEKSFNLKLGSGSLKYNFLKLYQKLIKDIKNSKNIEIFTNSRLIKFNYDFRKQKILSSLVYQGKEKLIYSKNHILTCGCLESNRIILQTFKKEKKYLKKYDIGKNISFHPTLELGKIKFKEKLSVNYDLFKKTLIFLKPKKYNYMNTGLSLSFNYSNVNSLIEKVVSRFRKKINHINIGLLIEHKKNKKNFISLSKKKYTKQDFKMNINTFIDRKNLDYIKKVSKSFSTLLKNKKNFKFIEKNNKILFETNNHHHGGLCFGNEKNFPVDKNFRLKGFKNLYICGSSLFPSSSCYGPTLTIMALSRLLADKIKKKFNVE